MTTFQFPFTVLFLRLTVQARDISVLSGKIKVKIFHYKENFCTSSVRHKLYIVYAHQFYVYETWPLALRAEHRLRVFENGVLRKISGPRRAR